VGGNRKYCKEALGLALPPLEGEGITTQSASPKKITIN